MKNKPDCIKCTIKCECLQCKWFYTRKEYHQPCMKAIIDNGCLYKKTKIKAYIGGEKCGAYDEVDWVDKIKYYKKLRMFEKE